MLFFATDGLPDHHLGFKLAPGSPSLYLFPLARSAHSLSFRLARPTEERESDLSIQSFFSSAAHPFFVAAWSLPAAADEEQPNAYTSSLSSPVKATPLEMMA